MLWPPLPPSLRRRGRGARCVSSVFSPLQITQGGKRGDGAAPAGCRGTRGWLGKGAAGGGGTKSRRASIIEGHTPPLCRRRNTNRSCPQMQGTLPTRTRTGWHSGRPASGAHARLQRGLAPQAVQRCLKMHRVRKAAAVAAAEGAPCRGVGWCSRRLKGHMWGAHGANG
ncbi:MAG: hypothetical protein J3K34DRAFT_284503 [Monoraphidium minutum]|nr:MAG: hypothetical protein J3K34DRAFT_284503 [Monoraphidium minutum]